MKEAAWIAAFSVGRRAARQRNRVGEADAEILDLGDRRLAITVDTLAEEFRFLQDPETIGWLAAIASLSDLLAVGARPEGLLLSVELPLDAWEDRRDALIRGVLGCLEAHGTCLLGGDTNDTPHTALTTVGVGTVQRPLLRSGARPGDILLVVGEVGRGNLVALQALQSGVASPLESSYRPTLPVEAWLQVCDAASACTDSSDGLLAAVASLALSSGCGFDLEEQAIPYAGEVRSLPLPLLAFAAGGVGDYGLVFTVPGTELSAFLARAGELSVRAIGRATPAGIRIGGRCAEPSFLLELASRRSAAEVLAGLTGLLGDGGAGHSHPADAL